MARTPPPSAPPRSRWRRGSVSDSSALESGPLCVEERVVAMERVSHDMAHAHGRKRASCGCIDSSGGRGGGQQRQLRRSERERKVGRHG
jgi:hypothetical protein